MKVTVRKWMKETADFCREKVALCITAGIMMILLYGRQVFSLNYFNDISSDIFQKNTTMNWLEIGRPGMILTQKVFGLSWINPYFIGLLSLALFPIVVLMMVRLFYGAGLKNSKAALWAFVLIGITSPIWVYQFYYVSQSFEIIWALFLLVCVGAMFQIMFIQEREAGEKPNFKHRIWWFVAEVVLLLWAFSTYQVLPVVFLSLIAGLFWISLTREDVDCKVSDALRELLWMLGVFFATCIIGLFVVKLFFDDGTNISLQTAWGSWELESIMGQIGTYLWRSFIGADLQYSWMMGLGIIGAVVSLIGVLRRKGKDSVYKLTAVITMIVVWLSANITVFYLGIVPVIRSQISYVIVMAFLVMLVFDMIEKARKKEGSSREEKGLYNGLYVIVGVVCVIGVWSQMQNSLRLWYTDDVVTEQDVRIAQKVSDDIEALGLGEEYELPVVFVGNYDSVGNEACFDTTKSVYAMRDLSVGTSCWGLADEEPERIYALLENLFGKEYEQVSDETRWYAGTLVEDMPSYPANGYVQCIDGLVIVKMSENY